MEYHYILTVQYPWGDGYATVTNENTITVSRRSTRLDALRVIRANAMKQLLSQKSRAEAEAYMHGNIIFFSIEPNRL